MIRCDHPECIAPSIGYADRQLQGPFYCQAHEQWALDIVHQFYSDIQQQDDSLNAQQYIPQLVYTKGDSDE